MMSQFPQGPPPGPHAPGSHSGYPSPYGAQPGFNAPPYAPPKSSNTGLIIAIIAAVAVGLVVIVGILAVLGIYGVRKYIGNAKASEARMNVTMIAMSAVHAYDGEGDALGAGGHRLCPSASSTVPVSPTAIAGRKYQSTVAEWGADESANRGFACLGFSIAAPQYYQYEYQATDTSFVVRAHGDLNADGVMSTYERRGRVVGDHVELDPVTYETNPME